MKKPVSHENQMAVDAAKLLERYARAIRAGQYKVVCLNRDIRRQQHHSAGTVGRSTILEVTWYLSALTDQGEIILTATESRDQFERAEKRKRHS